MTEQKILVYKLSLSLYIPDFSLFFVEKMQPLPPLKKSHPLLSHQPPPLYKLRSCQAHPPLFENLVGGSTPPSQQKEGEGTLCPLLL